jgi:hypothetical protein
MFKGAFGSGRTPANAITLPSTVPSRTFSSSVVHQILQGLCVSTRQLRLPPFSVAKEEGKMNKDDDMPGLEAFMRDALEEAYARELPRPWLLVATGINGYNLCLPLYRAEPWWRSRA